MASVRDAPADDVHVVIGGQGDVVLHGEHGGSLNGLTASA
jgi:hypothetical protein